MEVECLLDPRFSCLFDNLYCPKRNPNGIVSLGVAENLLCVSTVDYMS
jgi:hypothetical protein